MRYDAGAAAYDDLTGRWSRLYATAAIEATGIRSGNIVLDLATGTADAALAAAFALGASGSVCGVDLSLPMLRVGASKLHAERVHLVAADAARLPFATRTFHAATCLFGLMLFPQPLAALRELLRVLADDGVAALTTWGTADRAPFAGIMAQALAGALPDHATEILKPFSMNDPVQVVQLMETAGFREATVVPLVRDGTYDSIEAYLQPYECGGGRLGQFYLSLDPAARARVSAEVRDALAPHASGGVVKLQVQALLFVARA